MRRRSKFRRRGHIIGPCEVATRRREKTAISPTAEIIADLRAGNIVVLVDDEDRENEGDLVFAADFVTPEKVNFLATHGRGLICMPLTAAHAERLGLRPLVSPGPARGTTCSVPFQQKGRGPPGLFT